MLEHLPLAFGYRLIRDGWAYLRGRRRKLSPQQAIQLRQRWKPEFEAKILEWNRKHLRKDVIIRDMRRIDGYPDLDEKEKRISAWFRVGLVDTYHKGIQVGLSWETLTMDRQKNEWRWTNRKAGENGELKVILIGYVPFENIESVDWDGDEYYGYPHIYCYFDARRKEPYERLAFCEEKEVNGIPFYTEVVDYEKARKLSKKRGIEHF